MRSSIRHRVRISVPTIKRCVTASSTILLSAGRCILVLVLIMGLSSCASSNRYVGREEGIEYSRELSRRIPRRVTHRLIVERFPTDRNHRLLVRLERTTELDLEYVVYVRDIDVWEKPRWHYETLGDVADSNPVIGLLYVPFTSIDLLEDAIYGPKYYEKFRVPVQGSDRTEVELQSTTETTPVAGQSIVVQNVGKKTTDHQGLVSFQVHPEIFKTPTRIEWEGQGIAYELAVVSRICKKSDRYKMLKTGNLVFSIYSKGRLSWLLLAGRITPVSFVVGLVIDVASGLVIEYVIERLETGCTVCGYAWEIRHVEGPTLNLKCPKCGSKGRLHVHVDMPSR